MDILTYFMQFELVFFLCSNMAAYLMYWKGGDFSERNFSKAADLSDKNAVCLSIDEFSFRIVVIISSVTGHGVNHCFLAFFFYSTELILWSAILCLNAFLIVIGPITTRLGLSLLQRDI